MRCPLIESGDDGPVVVCPDNQVVTDSCEEVDAEVIDLLSVSA